MSWAIGLGFRKLLGLAIAILVDVVGDWLGLAVAVPVDVMGD